MTSPKTIWVIILNWNGREHLDYCLPTLIEADYSKNVQLLLVDADSNDDSLEITRSIGEDAIEIYELGSNPGWAGGNNKAIEYATRQGAEYVVLLNNDMRFSKHWLTHSMEVFEREAKAGIVGCAIFNDLQEYHQARNAYARMSYTETDFIPGCCMIISTELLKKVGLIDNQYEFYCEEDDLEKRAVQAGFKLYQTNLPVWHFHDGSMRHFPEKKAYLAMRNTVLFSRKYDPVYLTLIKMVHISLCATLKNYRKHAISNQRYYAKNPWFNLKIYARALNWNLKDIRKRGWKATATAQQLNEAPENADIY